MSLITFMDEEFRYEDYKQWVKDKCIGCGAKIHNPWENYLARGNWCPNCSSKTEKLRKSKKLIKQKERLEEARALDKDKDDSGLIGFRLRKNSKINK